MANFLALETSTDACSMALLHEGEITERHEVIPRQHSQRLFGMLAELLPHGRLREQGVDAVVYGVGPGSFTGLRICASAVQGLCFANDLPAVPVSTLLAQTYTALRQGAVRPGDWVLSTLDANIGELYWSVYRVSGSAVEVLEGPRVGRPQALTLPSGDVPVTGIGSGLNYLDQLPRLIRDRLQLTVPELLPHARDLFAPAELATQAGHLQSAEQVCPLYVRDEISWKKLSEQGKSN